MEERPGVCGVGKPLRGGDAGVEVSLEADEESSR